MTITAFQTSSALQKALEDEIHLHRLPSTFQDVIQNWYQPVAEYIAEQYQSKKAALHSQPLVLGIQGLQGSGKSTCSAFLKILLEEQFSLKTINLSIDDFYHTRDKRIEMSAQVHPLLKTRGVPGTHDCELAIECLKNLENASPSNPVKKPSFDKSIDDRVFHNLEIITDRPHIIILEGWCVGLKAQSDELLKEPINELEKNEDKQGIWRHFSNDALKTTYQSLFSLIDTLMILNAPSFECVYQWRALQEKKLREKVLADNMQDNKVLSADELKRFISHYERLSRHALESLPDQANIILELNAQQTITQLTFNEESVKGMS